MYTYICVSLHAIAVVSSSDIHEHDCKPARANLHNLKSA